MLSDRPERRGVDRRWQHPGSGQAHVRIPDIRVSECVDLRRHEHRESGVRSKCLRTEQRERISLPSEEIARDFETERPSLEEIFLKLTSA